MFGEYDEYFDKFNEFIKSYVSELLQREFKFILDSETQQTDRLQAFITKYNLQNEVFHGVPVQNSSGEIELVSMPIFDYLTLTLTEYNQEGNEGYFVSIVKAVLNANNGKSNIQQFNLDNYGAQEIVTFQLDIHHEISTIFDGLAVGKDKKSIKQRDQEEIAAIKQSTLTEDHVENLYNISNKLQDSAWDKDLFGRIISDIKACLVTNTENCWDKTFVYKKNSRSYSFAEIVKELFIKITTKTRLFEQQVGEFGKIIADQIALAEKSNNNLDLTRLNQIRNSMHSNRDRFKRDIKPKLTAFLEKFKISILHDLKGQK